MTEQAFQATTDKKFVKQDALFPTDPDEIMIDNPSILIGEDAINNPEKSSANLFDPFFDDFVKFASDPSPVVEYEAPKSYTYEADNVVTFDRAELLDQKYNDLLKYTKTGFINGDVTFDPALLTQNQVATLDSICETIVQQGIAQARERQELRQPAHVVHTDTDPDPETTNRFMAIIEKAQEPVKAGISKTLAILGIANHFAISQPLQVITPAQQIEADKNALHDDLSGKEITVTINSVKP